MQTISIKKVRENLAEIIEQVAIGGKSFTITKFGKVKAQIVPVKKDREAAKGKELASALDKSFGMWADRKDIKDSAKWVADLRKKTSSRYGKLFD